MLSLSAMFEDWLIEDGTYPDLEIVRHNRIYRPVYPPKYFTLFLLYCQLRKYIGVKSDIIINILA
jgi:hypothetical protein